MSEHEGSSSPFAYALVFLHPDHEVLLFADDVEVRLVVVLVSHSVFDPATGLVSLTGQNVEPDRRPPATDLARST